MSIEDGAATESDEQLLATLEIQHEDALAKLEALKAQTSAETVPSGILVELAAVADEMDAFDGGRDAPVVDQIRWFALWEFLDRSRVAPVPAFDGDLRADAVAVRDDGMVPIFIADFQYERPRPRWDAFLGGEIGGGKETLELSRLIMGGQTFIGAALLREEVDLFSPVPGRHYGLEVTFIVPATGYRSNTARTPVSFTFDFGNGATRDVAAGEPLTHGFSEPGIKQLAVTLRSDDGSTRTVRFELEVAESAPPPNAVWSHGGGDLDKAYVYYGSEGGQTRTRLKKPVLLADGFPGGRSLDQLWKLMNVDASNFVVSLLSAGNDVILVGFQDGAKAIEKSAAQYRAVLERAIREKPADQVIAAGGASMGGLVARYALCEMQDPDKDKDHHVRLFFTIDTPHFGANIPFSVQAFIQLYHDYSSYAAVAAALMASPAAQQMLLHWCPPKSEWRSGRAYPVRSPLRDKFVWALEAIGWMPQKARRVAVADGLGTGTGNGVPPGALAFNFECTTFFWARLSASNTSRSRVVEMVRTWGLHREHWWWDAGGQRIDGAPGGTRATWKEAYDGVGGSVIRHLHHPSHCFVPSTSACAIEGDLYKPVSIQSSELHAFATSSTTNLEHVALPEELKKFLLDEIVSATAAS